MGDAGWTPVDTRCVTPAKMSNSKKQVDRNVETAGEGSGNTKERITHAWRFDVDMPLPQWRCQHLYVQDTSMPEDMAYRLAECVVQHLAKNEPIRLLVAEFAPVPIMEGIDCVRQVAYPEQFSFLVARMTKGEMPPNFTAAATPRSPTAATGAWKLLGRGVCAPIPVTVGVRREVSSTSPAAELSELDVSKTYLSSTVKHISPRLVSPSRFVASSASSSHT